MHIQWRYLDLSAQWNTRQSPWLRFLELKLATPWSKHQWLMRVLWNSPVTVTSQLSPLFVKKSTFSSRYIVHPAGGGAAKLVCESCGAEYPYVANPSGCAFCAVMKESGIQIRVGHRDFTWLWSDWGWAIKHNGYFIGEEIKQPMPAIKPTRFKAKHKAMAAAFGIEKQEWALELNKPKRGYEVLVEPYPIQPIQPARPDPAIMASIFGGQPGIGAKPVTLGRKSLP